MHIFHQFQTTIASTLLGSLILFASIESLALNWAKVKAINSKERSWVANTGATIEAVADDYVAVLATDQELETLQNGPYKVEVSFTLDLGMLDFPSRDSRFHNYSELNQALDNLLVGNEHFVANVNLGTTHEGRYVRGLRISFPIEQSQDKPGAIFMGGHHAREHLSVEMPLMLAQYLVREYNAGNARVQNLVNNRQIHIIPMVNPDGAEYDIESGAYKHWRKNRRANHNGTMGVDLNRNYGFMWGTGGSSSNPSSDTYKGEHPFSEPETQAIRDYLLQHRGQLTTLLTYHSFSELILYPWGHKETPIEDSRAFRVHKTMAETMAQWNQYKPMQASGLYVASGDTTDFAFGELGMISFTFELDPKSMFGGGFYPGQRKIDIVFRKNIEPALYIIENSINPYGTIEPKYKSMGFSNFSF